MGYSQRFGFVITDAGFEFRLLDPTLTDAQADQLLAFDQGRSLRHPFTPEMLGARVINERALIRELGAEAVVIGTTVSQLISARAERVPLAYVKPFAYSSPHLRGMRRTGSCRAAHGWAGSPTAHSPPCSVPWRTRSWKRRNVPARPRAHPRAERIPASTTASSEQPQQGCRRPSDMWRRGKGWSPDRAPTGFTSGNLLQVPLPRAGLFPRLYLEHFPCFESAP